MSCAHTETAIRRKRGLASARPVYQCTECKEVTGNVPASVIRDMPRDELRNLRFAVPNPKKQPNSRKRAYQAALQTPRWKKLRETVFARAGGVCEVPGCEEEATDLAHLHYEKPLGEETEAEVQAQCAVHNQAERVERITRHVLG